MRLDYIKGTGAYVLRVDRTNAMLVASLVREHGLDFSTSASTEREAVLFTKEPFAALTFWDNATPAAKEQLNALKIEVEASRAPADAGHFRTPPDQELWPFQRASLAYALRRNNTLIGDQPGLGKTPIAICYANEIGAKNVLVVVPASIRLQWVRRIYEWSTMQWPYVVHPILHGRRGVHPTAEWTVVSYDLVRSHGIAAALAKRQFDLLILDEAHYLKTIDAHRTRAIFGGGKELLHEPIASRARNILALTGTPLPNRPREAYTLTRNLCWDAIDWASEDAFRARFNPSYQQEFTDAEGNTRFWIDERSGRHAELQNRLRANYMVRHLKREVLPQLHLPIYDLIQVEETGAVRAALQAESLLDIDPDSLEGADAEVLGHVAVVRRMMGLAMAPQVVDYVSMLIDGGEDKITLFAWHIEVMNILEQGLMKHGVVRIDGRTGAEKKERLISQFINDPNIQVCLGNLQSMGVGTDGLQKVSAHALIAEASWTPGDNVQAFDRLDRGGQARQVQGDIFVAPNSFAERVLAAALRKLQVTDAALDKKH